MSIIIISDHTGPYIAINLCRWDRPSRSGGVAIYIREDVNLTEVNVASDQVWRNVYSNVVM